MEKVERLKKAIEDARTFILEGPRKKNQGRLNVLFTTDNDVKVVKALKKKFPNIDMSIFKDDAAIDGTKDDLEKIKKFLKSKKIDTEEG
jgi:hypothetical protein